MTDKEAAKALEAGVRTHPVLPYYEGPYPVRQYQARQKVEELVRQSDNKYEDDDLKAFVSRHSRQSYAVLQVLIDEIERLKERVHELEQAVWRGR